MRGTKLMWLGCAGVAGILGWAGLARAVIVEGTNGTGTANTQPPFPVAGLNNVGVLGFSTPASGVYIGNGWGLTAAHVSAVGSFPGAMFTVAGSNYTIDATHTFTNADNSTPDLIAFHLTSNPPLAALALASVSPTLGMTIDSMGDGLTRSANTQFYSVTGSGNATVWTPLPGPAGANASGYTESTPNVLRWGNNKTTTPIGGAPGSATTVINTGSGNTSVFASTFDTGVLDSEMQLSSGDSGGGVFDASNVLLGINDVPIPFQNQPADTAIFGDQSVYVDVATYHDQITALLPEPSAVCVLALGAAAGLLRRRHLGKAF